MGTVCIREPNLPHGRVTLAAVSGKAVKAAKALERLGVAVLSVDECPALPEPIFSHPDMLCHPLGGRDVLVARGNDNLREKLRREGFLPAETRERLCGVYPEDILLNAARIGDLCFGSQKCEEKLQRVCREKNIRFIPVRQGYAKCSTVVVSQRAILTADPSIAKAAEACGVDVLRVRAGYVELPGYSYGFLGGACGKLSQDVLAFAGDLSQHPDSDAITAFLRNYHIAPLSLYGGALMDIGGILPLREEEIAQRRELV